MIQPHLRRGSMTSIDGWLKQTNKQTNQLIQLNVILVVLCIIMICQDFFKKIKHYTSPAWELSVWEVPEDCRGIILLVYFLNNAFYFFFSLPHFFQDPQIHLIQQTLCSFSKNAKQEKQTKLLLD